MRKPRFRAEILAPAFCLLLATAATAQPYSSSLSGTVSDAEGSALPGTLLTLSGPRRPETRTADAQGRFHFLGLPPGLYRLSAQSEGRASVVYEEIPVALGQHVTLDLEMMPAFEEGVTITAEPPLLDPRNLSRSTRFSQTDLEKIPTARDIWDTLRQVPGVFVDRVNVGGNQSTEQSLMVGPGAGQGQHAWSIDGVVITEPETAGASGSFFDFGSFAEVQVTTGGSDASVATGGVTTNLVTRRGTNDRRGSVHWQWTDDSLQEDTDFDRGDLARPGPWNLGNGQSSFAQGNRIIRLEDLGGEAGGPLVRDHLWGWVSWGRQDIGLRTLGDYREQTRIEAASAKLDAQIGAGTSLNLFFLDAVRDKTGRNVGPLRPPETSWHFPFSSDVLKLEAAGILSPSLYLSGAVSSVHEIVDIEALGGNEVNAVLGRNGIWRGSFISGRSDRPQRGAKVDAVALYGGRTQHEVRAGLGYRLASSRSRGNWPGLGEVVGLASTLDTLGFALATANVGTRSEVERESWGAYLQDTLTWGDLTVSLGLRYDDQTGSNGASSLPANELFPDLLPGRTFSGSEAGFDWRLLAPRLGLTWAAGERKQTLWKASYARFGTELTLTEIGHANPTSDLPTALLGASQFATFIWLDDGDGIFERNEIGPVVALGAADPQRPDFFPNAIDPDFSPPVTDEIVLGAQRSLGPNAEIELAATWRNTRRVMETERLVFEDAAGPRTGPGRAHTRNDYVHAFTLNGILPDGTPYEVPVYRLRPGLTWLGGTLLTNGDREQEYLGLTLSLHRRLADRWMLRGNAQWNRWRWKVPDGSIKDPTPRLPGDFADGGAVVQDTVSFGGVKTAVYLNSRWALNVNGLYQVAPQRPWGFDVGFDLYARDGYPVPYFQTVTAASTGDGIARQVLLVREAGSDRNDDVLTLNLRVGKEISWKRGEVALGLEVFNLFNDSAVLQRQNELGIPVGAHVLEVLSPRVYRLGLQVRLR